jgi:hypothetical protein
MSVTVGADDADIHVTGTFGPALGMAMVTATFLPGLGTSFVPGLDVQCGTRWRAPTGRNNAPSALLAALAAIVQAAEAGLPTGYSLNQQIWLS